MPIAIGKVNAAVFWYNSDKILELIGIFLINQYEC